MAGTGPKNMDKLHLRSCRPCIKTTTILTNDVINYLLQQLNNDWKIKNNYLYRLVNVKNFKQAIELTNKIATIAEKENHHPDINISWSNVEIKITTHVVSALTENDFILAAKIDHI